MSISRASLQKTPLSYASCSIGCGPKDTLPRRLEAISAAGFTAIELSFPDILDHGLQITGQPISPTDYPKIIPIAEDIRKLCDSHGLSIMMLQPFSNLEGWVKGSMDREQAFARASGWMEVMNVVGTDLLQVCNYTLNQVRQLTKFFPKRSEQQIHLSRQFPANEKPSSPIYVFYPNSSPSETTDSPTKTGAGQPTPQAGKQSGKS